MDAIKLLKADHEEMRGLLSDLESTTSRGVKKRQQLIAEIEAKLKAHTTIEEEIFYPAFREAGQKSDDDKMYFEALEEHRAAGDLVLPDLLNTDPASEKFSGRAKVLKELVEHHADEEERKCSRARRSSSIATSSPSSASGSKRARTNCSRAPDRVFSRQGGAAWTSFV